MDDFAAADRGAPDEGAIGIGDEGLEGAGLAVAAGGGDFERSGLRVRGATKFNRDFGLETGLGELGFAFAGPDEDDAVALFDPTTIEAWRVVVRFGADLNQGDRKSVV